MTAPDDRRVDPADERRHPAGSDGWSESWYLDFIDAEGGVAGSVRLGLYPDLGTAWYWACLVGLGRQLVTVIDHDVPMPLGRSLEIRTEGLWADLAVETPLDHVTVGLEAFAVGVDDPAEVYGRLRGDRVPLGFDLEWETDGGVDGYRGAGHYEIPCRVHGEVLVGQERIDLDGWGQRSHSWGAHEPWATPWSRTAGRLDDGTRFHGATAEPGAAGWPDDGSRLHAATSQAGAEPSFVPSTETGYVQARGGPMERVEQVVHRADLGSHGFPSAATWRIGALDLAVEPVALSPVLVNFADGRTSRLVRAWCSLRAEDGRTGHGWTAWNQPDSQPFDSARRS